MIAANRKPVAVAAEKEDVQVRAGQADTGSQGDGTPVDEMGAVRVHKIGKAGGAANPGQRDDALMRELTSLQNLVKGGQDGEIAATRTPSRMVGGQELSWSAFPGTGAIVAVVVSLALMAKSLKNFFDPKGQAIGLGQALDFRIAKPGSEQRGKLPKSIKTLVVHFGDDDSIEPGKDVSRGRWEADADAADAATRRSGRALWRDPRLRESGRKLNPNRRSGSRLEVLRKLRAEGFPRPVA